MVSWIFWRRQLRFRNSVADRRDRVRDESLGSGFCVREHDEVAAFALGSVEGRVAGGEEFALVDSVRGAGGDADADGDRADLFERIRADGASQTLGGGHGLLAPDAREKQGEL